MAGSFGAELNTSDRACVAGAVECFHVPGMPLVGHDPDVPMPKTRRGDLAVKILVPPEARMDKCRPSPPSPRP